jgi:hypothetical protein
MRVREQEPTTTSPGSEQGQHAGTVLQPFIGFLDRNLNRFSRPVRDVIGLGFLGMLVVLVLHGFVAPTYVEGSLWVKPYENEAEEMAKSYILSRGAEEYVVNENGHWMLPMRGAFPGKHTITVQDKQENGLGEFRIWGPWPVYNAFYTSQYKVTVHTYKQSSAERVQVSYANAHRPVSSMVAVGFGVKTAHAQPVFEPWQVPSLLVHLGGLGDVACRDGSWCGTRGESRRLEGFAIQLPQPPGDVRLKYLCHIEGAGDTPWLSEGEFCGTKGEAKRLEGFSIQIEGQDAGNYNIAYQARVQDMGDTPVVRNGEFAGTRGESRRVEAMRVWLERRN